MDWMTLSAGECNSDFLISTLVHGGEGVKYGTNSPYSQEAMHFGTKKREKNLDWDFISGSEEYFTLNIFAFPYYVYGDAIKLLNSA